MCFIPSLPSPCASMLLEHWAPYFVCVCECIFSFAFLIVYIHFMRPYERWTKRSAILRSRAWQFIPFYHLCECKQLLVSHFQQQPLRRQRRIDVKTYTLTESHRKCVACILFMQFSTVFLCHVSQFNLFNVCWNSTGATIFSSKIVIFCSTKSKCDKWNGFIYLKVVTKSLNLRFVTFRKGGVSILSFCVYSLEPTPFVRWICEYAYVTVCEWYVCLSLCTLSKAPTRIFAF